MQSFDYEDPADEFLRLTKRGVSAASLHPYGSYGREPPGMSTSLRLLIAAAVLLAVAAAVILPVYFLVIAPASESTGTSTAVASFTLDNTTVSPWEVVLASFVNTALAANPVFKFAAVGDGSAPTLVNGTMLNATIGRGPT